MTDTAPSARPSCSCYPGVRRRIFRLARALRRLERTLVHHFPMVGTLSVQPDLAKCMERRRKRRNFTRECKAEVVRQVRTSGETILQVAREPDLGETGGDGGSRVGARRSTRSEIRTVR